MSRRKEVLSLIVAVVLTVTTIAAASAQSGPPVRDDPLLRMPGTQPVPENEVDINEATNCVRCHGNYDPAVEPGNNWMGSMMAQAGRDFLMWACFATAMQDSMWATGSPNATDLCERCHFPGGWLGGRSDPVNATEMRLDDFDGMTCDFCHRMYDPFFQDTYAGLREGSDWLNYWDETNLSKWPSQAAANQTYVVDRGQSTGILLFNGAPFFGADHRPVSPAYTENAAGQFFVSTTEQRRASFADSHEGHDRLYSRYHKSRYFCSTCHDVSNSVFANLGADPALPLPTETQPAYSYFHVERTWSEFALSAYGQQGGAAGLGPFAPAVFETSYANNYVAKCQDCHMQDVVGQGSTKNNAVLRPTESVEHPLEGVPLHDMTGGNAWVSWVLASAIPGSPVFDQINHDLLYQGPAVLTLDLEAGIGITPTNLLAGVERAKQQLQKAGAIENLAYDPATGALAFRIQNQTGHKLISGFPEGRRMFVNVQAYAGGSLIYEINPYDYTAGTLKSMPGAPLGPNEEYVDTLVYESKPSSLDVTGEAKTFHFVLATDRFKDNRIPPQGFQIAQAGGRLIEPAFDGAIDPNYFTPAEYAGGYDDVAITIPAGADDVQVRLYYQTTSREYIEFLRDEINGTGNLTLPPEAYIVQTDPFFSQLAAWGDTIWALWDHNKDVPGAAPYLMAEAGWQGAGPVPAPPVLRSVTLRPGRVVLLWSPAHLADPLIVGYRIYRIDAGIPTQIGEVGLSTRFVDLHLPVAGPYCYHVTALYTGAESAPSNELCTP